MLGKIKALIQLLPKKSTKRFAPVLQSTTDVVVLM